MSEGENKRAHLQMIQGVIDRMAQNSFRMKEWAIALVTAILALSIERQQATMAGIAFLPIFMFWGLDAYYLCQERRFRCLFDRVRKVDDQAIDFCMDRKGLAPVPSWLTTMFGCRRGLPNLLFVFYGVLSLLSLIAMIALSQYKS